jgi:hypothetical protein
MSTSKLMNDVSSQQPPPPTTSYIVVMTGSAGSIYQPLQHANNALLPSFAILPQRPLTIPGTSVPLPLQPLANFSPNHHPLSDHPMSDLLSNNLPSLDLLCSNIEDCESTLDDIEQVLKDAENFDILA